MGAPAVGGSIDVLVSVDARVLGDDGLRTHVKDFASARARLAAAEATAIAEFDDRGLAIVDGAVNTPSWLAHHTGEPRAVSGGRVKFAKRLRHMPLVAAALAAGTIGEAHARAVGRCLTPRTVEAFERDARRLP